MNNLTEEERKEIAVILSRRANEIAEFKAEYTKDRNHFGSVEMALSREITRLRDLSIKIDVAEEED